MTDIARMLASSAGIAADGHKLATAKPGTVPAENYGMDNVAPVIRVPRKLTLRSPDEILGIKFDDSDRILGDRLLAKGQNATLCGASSVGKSRLALQMGAASITGRKFLTLETGGVNLTWLFIQAENSNRRLQFDLAKLQAWIGDHDWPVVNERLIIHTLESDDDGFLNLELNPQTFIYEPDPAFDMIAWQADMTGKKLPKRAGTPEGLLALVPLEKPVAKALLIDRWKDRHGNHIKGRAFLDELIESGKLHEWRVKRPGTNAARLIARHPQPDQAL